MEPDNAHILHNQLELNINCVYFDPNSGCSGYVYGLLLAYPLL